MVNTANIKYIMIITNLAHVRTLYLEQICPHSTVFRENKHRSH